VATGPSVDLRISKVIHPPPVTR